MRTDNRTSATFTVHLISQECFRQQIDIVGVELPADFCFTLTLLSHLVSATVFLHHRFDRRPVFSGCGFTADGLPACVSIYPDDTSSISGGSCGMSLCSADRRQMQVPIAITDPVCVPEQQPGSVNARLFLCLHYPEKHGARYANGVHAACVAGAADGHTVEEIKPEPERRHHMLHGGRIEGHRAAHGYSYRWHTAPGNRGFNQGINFRGTHGRAQGIALSAAVCWSVPSAYG